METDKKPKKVATHPKYRDMILSALSTLRDRNGSSRQAIIRYIMTYFDVGNDEKKVNVHVKLALKAGLKTEMFKQVKGTGASGSFKPGDAAKKEKPKPEKKENKTAKTTAKPKAKTDAKKTNDVKDKKKSPKRKVPVGKVAEKKGKKPKITPGKTPQKKLPQIQKLKTPKKQKAR